MFIQVIHGRCRRPEELRELLAEWRDQQADDATGWLGATYGFADDDRFVAVVRFDSPEAARANAERPEQTAWAERLSALFDGEIGFHDCDDVTALMGGGSDDAGFVQVISGRTDDVAALRALMSDDETLRRIRPDVLGATLAVEPDGTYHQTVYFSSEAEAREGERREAGRGEDIPDDARRTLEEVAAGASYLDLSDPWFASP